MNIFKSSTLLICFLFLNISIAVAQQQVGQAISVIGDVSVSRTATAQLPLNNRDKVYLNDQLSTAEGSYAKLMLLDESILKIAANSQLVLSKVLVGLNEKETIIKQMKGRLRSIIGKKLKPLAKYEIHTPVAVAGVRGTDFEVWVSGSGITVIRCFEGVVAVRNIDEPGATPVLVKANYFTLIEKGKPPTEPMAIAADMPLGQMLPGFSRDFEGIIEGYGFDFGILLDQIELIGVDIKAPAQFEGQLPRFNDAPIQRRAAAFKQFQDEIEPQDQLETITDPVMSAPNAEVPIDIYIPTL